MYLAITGWGYDIAVADIPGLRADHIARADGVGVTNSISTAAVRATVDRQCTFRHAIALCCLRRAQLLARANHPGSGPAVTILTALLRWGFRVLGPGFRTIDKPVGRYQQIFSQKIGAIRSAAA
ncbi:hypothetical protein NPX13_g6572 [Xylaria arbuscula]|uniref:Uncharacterized protein n=1 Tax=Xylaria arbuscula TaxID=114810 RepID=A0A9W8TLM2_9PEZI|nr:hypothetical protein NPX13_g6572 [Xylaria arbuscula]